MHPNTMIATKTVITMTVTATFFFFLSANRT